MPNVVIQPSFNGFSLQDSNWITETIEFKGFAKRDFVQQPIIRREGNKVLGTQFREKSITLTGHVVAADSGTLQTLMDNMKQNLSLQEGVLIIEVGRQYVATAQDIKVPDQPYNQTIAPWEITFTTDDPFATATAALTVVINVPSGVFIVSGLMTISGSFYNRPTITYTPPNPPSAGDTLIKSMTVYHVPTAQSVTVSGLGNGTDLQYNSSVTVNMDTFQTLDGTLALNNSGSFPIWQPGVNAFTVSCDRGFPGGQIAVTYTPRYL